MATLTYESQSAEPIFSAAQLFRQELLDSGLLIDGGHPGLYGRSAMFENVCQSIDHTATRLLGEDAIDSLSFSLVMPKELLEQSDYIRSFPNLVGTVSGFNDDERQVDKLLELVEAGQGWSDVFEATSLGLCPASCHQLYPSQRGLLPRGGRVFEVMGQCFRKEPSFDPMRMQVFRQHELVYLGDEESARNYRDQWVDGARVMLGNFGIATDPVVANDPFFGRPGKMLAANQRTEVLKIELEARVVSDSKPTALASGNCHLDHFGSAFGINQWGGEVAHSACMGLGIERIALAMFREHGFDSARWPIDVRSELGWLSR